MKDDGQMMLLAGVLLVIGFIALAGLVSVAQRLGEATLQDEGKAVVLEAGSVAVAIDEAIGFLNATLADPVGSPGFDDQMNRTLRHMQLLEASRGYRFDFMVVNDCMARSTWRVDFSLADDATRVSLRSQVESGC